MRAELDATVHDPATTIAALFAPDGESVATGSDRQIALDSPQVFLVEQGAVDIFAIGRSHAGRSGSRLHVTRIEEGGLVLGAAGSVATATSASGLIAVGTAGTRCRELTRDAARARLAHIDTDDEARSAFAALVENWIDSLCGGMVREAAPTHVTELTFGPEQQLVDGEDARPRGHVAWIRHLDGHSLLLGKPGLIVNGVGPTPVSRRAWIKITEPVAVSVTETGALVADITLWEGLDRLQGLVLAWASIFEAHASASERDRLHRRLAVQQEVLVGACVRLARTLRPERRSGGRARVANEAPVGGRSAEAPVLGACRAVGASLGVIVRPYPMSEGQEEPRDPLAAIARASRLRLRRVVLRETWWRDDDGPLLAYLADGNHPVALLPVRRRGRSGYVMHDPRSGVGVADATVTAAEAELLAPIAYTFYRPFPDTPLTAIDVLKFGLRDCGRDLWIVLLMALSVALLGLIPSIATGMLFNSIIPGSQRSQLMQIMLVLIACAITSSLFQLSRGIALLRIESKMGSAVQAAVWDRLLSLPMTFFRPYAAGDLAVRAMGIDGIRQIISGTTITALFGGLFSLVNFGLMFYYSPTLAWQASILIAIAIGVSAAGSMLQLKPQRMVSELTAQTSGVVLQLLGSVGKLRVAGAEVQAFAVWARRFSRQREEQFKVRTTSNWVSAFNAAFPVLAFAVLFWSASSLIGKPAGVRTGDFLAFLSAFTTSSGALLATSMALLGALNAIPLYEQSRPILATPPEVDLAKSDPGTLTGDIDIQHASFRYTPDGPLVIRDLSLHIAPGEFVAFVGPSGSGKSTLLRLLLGFENLDGGAIYYDGQELGGLDIQAVRRQVGVVLQSGRLASGDIFTNIVGSAPVSMDDAWEAARMAGLDGDVRAMPMGMHTVISEGGGTLSGGQRQRLLIARALIHRPRLLFFDEATSALDNHTQAIVSHSLEQLQATRIVIAHRLSTIERADRICVVDKGRLAQMGTYDQLMSSPGPFAELARRQLV